MGRERYRAVNRSRGSALAEAVEVADTLVARLRGLLGRSGLGEGEGLWLAPCASIHTCFMKFAIDAAFVDADGRVVRLVRRMKPFRAASARGARAVLETASGALDGKIDEGDIVALEPAAGTANSGEDEKRKAKAAAL